MFSNGTAQFTNSQNLAFHISQGLKLFFLTFAIPFNVLLCLVIGKTRNLHSNAKILLVSFALVCLCRTMYQLSLTVYNLQQFCIQGPSGWSMSLSFCALISMPNTMGIIGFLILPAGIALERVYATKTHTTYDGKSPFFAFFVLLVTGLIVVIHHIPMTAALLKENNPFANQTIPYCDVMELLVLRYSLFAIIWIILGGLILVLGVIFMVIWTYMRAKLLLQSFGINQERLSLVSRLQLRHSVYITRMLIPLLLFHEGICCFCGIFLIFIGFKSNLDFPSRLIIMQYTNCLTVAISYVLIPVISLTCNKLFWTETVKLLENCGKFGVGKVHPTNEEDQELQQTHFQMLEQIWRKPKLVRIL